jgi:1-deoxy-D-xylulose-5-phosphate reductoisomerase
MKRLAILGSTGSIGQQALEIVRSFPDRLEVLALAAGQNIPLLTQQVGEFKPKLFFAQGLAGEALGEASYASMEEMASHPNADIVVIATSGKAGLSPTLAAVRSGKAVALSNKEALVMAGELVTSESHRYGAKILPIDSEMSAIWQCLEGEEAARLILTASGGPFRNYSQEQLAAVTAAEALKHPTWRMGKRITIDSATLMNKGFEVIEAHHLFHTPFEEIDVVLHPQSVVHSLVEFADGTLKAILSPPDMRFPIQYALSYPERWQSPELPHLDLIQLGSLTFEPVDRVRFPCFGIAIEAGREGGTYPAALCAADEVAVELFLEGRLSFLEIPKLVERVLSQHKGVSQPGLEDILEADAWARKAARDLR